MPIIRVPINWIVKLTGSIKDHINSFPTFPKFLKLNFFKRCNVKSARYQGIYTLNNHLIILKQQNHQQMQREQCIHSTVSRTSEVSLLTRERLNHQEDSSLSTNFQKEMENCFSCPILRKRDTSLPSLPVRIYSYSKCIHIYSDFP